MYVHVCAVCVHVCVRYICAILIFLWLKFNLEPFNLTFLHRLNICNLLIELTCQKLLNILINYELMYIYLYMCVCVYI